MEISAFKFFAAITTLFLSTITALSAQAAPFADNGDGTITDSATGLIWMRCAIKQTWSSGTCFGTAGKYTWKEATALTSTFAGQTDWRLPNIRELDSIVNRTTSNPAIDSAVFPETLSSRYFSATGVAGTSDKAFYVDFNDGTIGNDSYFFTGLLSLSVRLVRAGRSISVLRTSRLSADYVDIGEGAVKHTPTALMWKRCSHGQTWTGATCSGTATQYTWNKATAIVDSAAALKWRLPTEDELLTLVDYDRSGYLGQINTAIFPNTPVTLFSSNASFWSATKGSVANSVWGVYFANGFSANNYDKNSIRSVRLVSTGEAASAYTGLWWNENESGWGMSLTQQGSIVFAAWYAYDSIGKPIWYVISSCPVVGTGCTGDIYSVVGGTAPTTTWNGNGKVVTKIGTGAMVFSDMNTGTFNFTLNGIDGKKNITRQIFATGSTPPAIDYTALWWNPNESGWGVSLTQQFATIFATIYSYDAGGSPIWYASSCPVVDNGCTGDLYQVSGGTAPTFEWNGSNKVVAKVGTITLTFADSTNATIAYTINGANGSRAITRQLF